MEHRDVKIFGDMQDVGFRYSAKIKAEELEIFGFVRNEPDGSVYLEIEGDEEALEQFLSWCKHGFKSGKTEKMESQAGNIKNFSDFAIK